MLKFDKSPMYSILKKRTSQEFFENHTKTKKQVRFKIQETSIKNEKNPTKMAKKKNKKSNKK
jgi:hypothetical protein